MTEVARDSVAEERELVTGDLTVYCRGFCAALSGHHAGEDSTLFPELDRLHPGLRTVLSALRQNHHRIEHLVTELQYASDAAADRATLERHLDGIGAIMESHFRYEERALLRVLEDLRLEADPRAVLGPG